jgi:hypothetical protein
VDPSKVNEPLRAANAFRELWALHVEQNTGKWRFDGCAVTAHLTRKSGFCVHRSCNGDAAYSAISIGKHERTEGYRRSDHGKFHPGAAESRICEQPFQGPAKIVNCRNAAKIQVLQVDDVFIPQEFMFLQIRRLHC